MTVSMINLCPPLFLGRETVPLVVPPKREDRLAHTHGLLHLLQSWIPVMPDSLYTHFNSTNFYWNES